MAYELLEHTADLGVVVTAPTLEGLYAEALRALTDCITEVAAVAPREGRRIGLAAADRELLLVDWLGEALYLFETEGLVFSAAEVELQGGREDGAAARLEARLHGESFDSRRHPLKVQIKAVTYHGLEVRETEEGWRARVIFDI